MAACLTVTLQLMHNVHKIRQAAVPKRVLESADENEGSGKRGPFKHPAPNAPAEQQEPTEVCVMSSSWGGKGIEDDK